MQRLQHSVTTTACVVFSSTGRQDVVDAADAVAEHLTGDAEVYANPEQYFDQVIEINLDELTPHLNGRLLQISQHQLLR